MNILILGGDGMLGHAVAREAVNCGLRTAVTVRGDTARTPLPETAKVFCGIDARRLGHIAAAMEAHRADAVVNAIGVVKGGSGVRNVALAHMVNTILPHRLARHCEERGVRLIHVSTDCVFDGTRGAYRESDPISPIDAYGRTKADGEPKGTGVLTLRTSMVGLPGAAGRGLLGWFLGARGEVDGYTRATFSGPTTLELARIICAIVASEAVREGLYHVAAEPITKYKLLETVRDAFGLDTRILPKPSPVIDRSLDGSRFAHQTGYVAPSWPAMIEELARLRRAQVAFHGFGRAAA
ncbi:MAG: SDR family oxidoreductase [Pseudomonadota bacterium]